MAQSEATIANTNIIDIDSLMSDDFKIENMMTANELSRVEQLGKIADPQEIKSNLQLEAYMRAVGIVGQDNIQANKTAAQATFRTSSKKDTWGALKEGWNNNQIQLQIADTRLAEMQGRITPQQSQSWVTELKSKMKESRTSGFASFAKSAASMAPMMLETAGAGAKYAIPAGAAAAGTAALAGQAGPQILAPEEIITVPGAAMTFGSMGFMYGSANKAKDIEAGLMYDELMEFKDESGNRIDPTLAANIANTVGVINGMLEVAQIGDIIKTIPGGKKLIARAQRATIMNLAKNKTILKTVAGGAVKYAGHIGFETGTELGQETTNIIFDELAKNISNELDKTSFAPAAKKDIAKRLVDTAKESAKAFTLIAAPGNVINTSIEAAGVVAEKKEAGKPEGAKPVDLEQKTRPISRVMSSNKITPRVDINSLGKTMVDIPPELPPKKARRKVERDKTLTPEEEYALQQTESTLKATEEFEITPNLYIGNVTARMKEVMGEQFGVDPETVHGFTEGAWPTKRTKVKMSMDEARSLLVVMEESLQDRVDNDKLHTDSDLSRANADWGDIKELRRQLGLPKTLRPFRIIREKGTRTITITNTRERIAKTTQAGALDTVSTTKIQQLNDVLKRVAKAAKEGWAGGKKEARESYQLLQYVRKLKQMREKLVDKITADVSKDVDFFYREAVASLQNSIDWKVKTEGKKIEKENYKAFIERILIVKLRYRLQSVKSLIKKM